MICSGKINGWGLYMQSNTPVCAINRVRTTGQEQGLLMLASGLLLGTHGKYMTSAAGDPMSST